MSRAAVLAAAALLAASAAAAPAPGPLDLKAREWAAKGFPLKERIEGPAGPVTIAAAAYGNEKGDRLEAYVVLKGKAYLGYSHPSSVSVLELDGTPEGRGVRDLLRDGSRSFAYHATLRALNATSLVVVRYKDFKFARAAEFPEGRFATLDGAAVVIARELPLGRFLQVGCEDFAATSQTAFRTRVYRAAKGRFVDVSSRHPDFYASEIARKEAAVDRLKGDLQKNAGEYLGLALSLYYDYAARGDARAGWERQKDFFQVPGYAPSSVKKCFESMRAGLRGRLGVPADWP